MKRRRNSGLAWFLSLIMALTIFSVPTSIFAVDEEQPAQPKQELQNEEVDPNGSPEINNQEDQSEDIEVNKQSEDVKVKAQSEGVKASEVEEGTYSLWFQDNADYEDDPLEITEEDHVINISRDVMSTERYEAKIMLKQYQKNDGWGPASLEEYNGEHGPVSDYSFEHKYDEEGNLILEPDQDEWREGKYYAWDASGWCDYEEVGSIPSFEFNFNVNWYLNDEFEPGFYQYDKDTDTYELLQSEHVVIKDEIKDSDYEETFCFGGFVDDGNGGEEFVSINDMLKTANFFEVEDTTVDQVWGEDNSPLTITYDAEDSSYFTVKYDENYFSETSQALEASLEVESEEEELGVYGDISFLFFESESNANDEEHHNGYYLRYGNATWGEIIDGTNEPVYRSDYIYPDWDNDDDELICDATDRVYFSNYNSKKRTFSDIGGDVTNIEWDSNNEEVVKINEYDEENPSELVKELEYVGVGNATITVSYIENDEPKTYTANIEIRQEPELKAYYNWEPSQNVSTINKSIADIRSSEDAITIGYVANDGSDSFILSPGYEYFDVSWKTSDKRIVSFNDSGEGDAYLYYKKAGTAKITATAKYYGFNGNNEPTKKSISNSVTVNVINAKPQIFAYEQWDNVQNNSLLELGTSCSVRVLDSKGKKITGKWAVTEGNDVLQYIKSSSSKRDGYLRPLKRGNAKLQCTIGSKELTYDIEVSESKQIGDVEYVLFEQSKYNAPYAEVSYVHAGWNGEIDNTVESNSNVYPVTGIYGYAFECTGDDEYGPCDITLPENIEWISGDAFINSNITGFIVDPKNKNFIVDEGVLYSKVFNDNGRCIGYCVQSDIPSGSAPSKFETKETVNGKDVLGFKDYINFNKNVKQVVIPASMDKYVNKWDDYFYTDNIFENSNVSFILEDISLQKNFISYAKRNGLRCGKELSNDKATVEFLSPSYTYYGGYLKPAPIVKVDGTTLTKDKDYTVSYSNNVNTGIANVTIKGISGRYIGTIYSTFDIVPRNISMNNTSTKYYSASISTSSYTYSGGAKKPSIALYYVNGKKKTKLKYSRDYTVAYSNNVNAGTATATFTGRGNYTGVKIRTYKIYPKSIASMYPTGVKSTYVYNGENLVLSGLNLYTSKSKSKKLIANTDYTISPASFTKIGKYSVYFKGSGNYGSSIKKKITILPKTPGFTAEDLIKGNKSFQATCSKVAAGTDQTVSYQLQYSTYSSMKKAVTKTISAGVAPDKTSTLTVTKLKNKQKYYVQVRARVKVGSIYYYSGWSSKRYVIPTYVPPAL